MPIDLISGRLRFPWWLRNLLLGFPVPTDRNPQDLCHFRLSSLCSRIFCTRIHISQPEHIGHQPALPSQVSLSSSLKLTLTSTYHYSLVNLNQYWGWRLVFPAILRKGQGTIGRPKFWGISLPQFFVYNFIIQSQRDPIGVIWKSFSAAAEPLNI